MDKFIVLKLLNGEELICTYIDEDDNFVSIMFPMKVKYVPTRSASGKLAETISLAPYTYFAADDEYRFSKSQIIFIKELDSIHLESYHSAVDDFVGSSGFTQPANVDELKQLTDKLQTMFKDKIKDTDDLDESIFVNTDSKLIH